MLSESMKKLFFLFLLTVLLVLGACSSDDQEAGNEEQGAEVEENNETNEEDSDEKDEEEPASKVSVLPLHQEEAISIEEGNFEVVTFEDAVHPNDYYYFFASNGTLIFENDDRAIFTDYQTGSRVNINPVDEETQNQADEGNLNTWEYSALYDNTYYFDYFRPTDTVVYDHDDIALYEIDVVTNEMIEIADAEDSVITTTKKDDILYIAEAERIYALDVNSGDTLWETEVGISDMWNPNLYVTDNSLIAMNLEEMTVYSLENGEKLFEETGLYYDLAADGDMFYTLANVSSGVDYELQIISYHETDGKQEELTEPIEIDMPYEDQNITIDRKNNFFYVHVENGVLAYDKDSYKLIWATATGEIEKRDATDDDFTYDVRAVYGDNNIYTFTEALSNTRGEGENFFSILDATTGEVKEHYSLGNGDAVGPFLDEETGKVFVYYYDTFNDDVGMAYILDAE